MDPEYSASVHAILLENTGELQRLLSAGADVNERAPYQYTESVLATTSNFVFCCLYAERNCDIALGTTLLHLAVLTDQIDSVQLLLNHNANVHSQEGCGFTALHFAANTGKIKCVPLLLRHGANVEASDVEGCTPLTHAADKGHVEVIQALLNHGANIQSIDRYGRTALHLAAASDRGNSIEVLLKNGMHINSTNLKGDTALHRACSWSSIDSFRILLEYGASYTLVNKEGRRPLDMTDRYMRNTFGSIINDFTKQTLKTSIEGSCLQQMANQVDSLSDHVSHLHIKVDQLQDFTKRQQYQIASLESQVESCSARAAVMRNVSIDGAPDPQSMIHIDFLHSTVDINTVLLARQKHHDFLIESMDPDPLVDHLWQEQAITRRQWEELSGCLLYPTHISRAEYLLQLINSGGPGYVQAFTTALVRTEQDYIARRLCLIT